MSDFLARLDAALVDHGLESVPWLLHGRKLRGTLDGRTLTGSVSARTSSAGGTGRRRYAGHRLELTLSTPLPARLVVFPPSGLRLLVARTNRWLGLREVSTAGPLAHLRGWTADVEWAARLLADDQATAAIADLLPPGGPPSAGLQLEPGRWWLSTLDHGERVLAVLPRSLEALFALADRAEALPAPAVPYQPGWAERHRTLVGVGVLLGCPAFFVLLGLLGATALVLLSHLLAR
jgi:hypothetical protein